jgi:serine/threonine protein kinase
MEEIGRGGSGKVSRGKLHLVNVSQFIFVLTLFLLFILALFAPTLSLLAIKKIEVKGAMQRKVVGQELKFLYEVARSALTDHGLLPCTENDPYLNLLSGQLYSDVIAGSHELPCPSKVFSSRVTANLTPTISPANSPYIINFYDAYIDSENGTVCLVLEYMNAGSIQNKLDKGEIFDENDSAVVAYSILNALVELHSRSILHRDIKPSNVLTNCSGRIKLTDFGIIKGENSFFFKLFLLYCFI